MAKNPSIKALPQVVTSLTFRGKRERFLGKDALHLRHMRVQLNDPSLMSSLLDYLRERDCVVEQIAVEVLAVWCPPAERSSAGELEMICRSCGTPIAETLGRLGSLRCHDCRDEGHDSLIASVYARANGNGRAREAREELTAYLAGWHAKNPGAFAAVID